MKNELIRALWEEIGTYSVQCAQTGKLAPSRSLREAMDAVQAALAASPVPACHVADVGFRWDGTQQCHIPKLVIEFEPVPPNAPCDAKGWRDRDQLAALLAAARSAPAQPATEQQAAIAWVRRHPDGSLTTDILPDAAIEPVRKASGAWLPLGVLATPPQEPQAVAQQTVAITDEMVSRFLTWPLPKTFSPDCGISFDGRKPDAMGYPRQWPVGTNLFTAHEARQMLEHIFQPASTAPSVEAQALSRVVEAAQAVTENVKDKIDYFEVPSHVMAPLALALDELAALKEPQQ